MVRRNYKAQFSTYIFQCMYYVKPRSQNAQRPLIKYSLAQLDAAEIFNKSNDNNNNNNKFFCCCCFFFSIYIII